MRFLSLAIISMAQLICWDAFIPIMPNLAKTYHVKPELITYGITIFALSYIISSQFTAYFIDKHSSGKIIKYGLFTAFLINISSVFINNFYLFLALRALLGLSLSVTIAVNSIIDKIYPKQEAVKIFSYLNSALGLGLVVAPLIGTQITKYLNYNFVFIFQGVYCLIGYYCTNKILNNEKLTISTHNKLNIKIIVQLLQNKDLIYISAIRTLSYLPHFLFVTFSSIFLLTVLKLSLNTYSIIMSWLGLAYILGGYLSKIINEKIGFIGTAVLGFLLVNAGTLIFAAININSISEQWGLMILLLGIYLLLISLGGSLLSPFCSKMLIEKCSHAISSASSLSMIYTYSFCSLIASLISQLNDLKNTLVSSSIISGITLVIIVLMYIRFLRKTHKEILVN